MVGFARLAVAFVAGWSVGCSGDDTGVSDTETDALPDLIGILVTPERVTVPLGQTVQLTATGLREDRTTLDVTAVATWSSDRPAIAGASNELDSEGLLSGRSQGAAEVVADVKGVKSVPVKVTVTEAGLIGLSVLPSEVVVQRGSSVRLQAEAAFSDGSRSDATSQVVWVTSNGQIATLEGGGKLNGVAVGTTTAYADWDGTRSGDVAVQVVQAANADLRVKAVQLSGGPDNITVTATIENTGGVGAADFWVDVFVDPPAPPAPGALGVDYNPIAYVGPGQTATTAFDVFASRGTHTVWVVIDSDGTVAESDENNNRWSGPVTVGGGGTSSGGPNLTIWSFDYYADEFDILYSVEVYNAGTQDVGQFWVDLWVDEDFDPTSGDLGDDFARVPSLEAGDWDYVDFLVDEWCYFCLSWVMVDTNREIAETNENDNVDGPLYVESP